MLDELSQKLEEIHKRENVLRRKTLFRSKEKLFCLLNLVLNRQIFIVLQKHFYATFVAFWILLEQTCIEKWTLKESKIGRNNLV